jgi:LacI family transcriptional regulator
VVNEEPNVRDEVIARVKDAIQKLGYEPDLHAGNLRRHNRDPQTIGVIVGNVANSFWAEILRAIEDVAVARGVAMFASSYDADVDRELHLVRTYLRRRVDALIIATIAPNQEHLLREQTYGTPVVFMDRPPIGIGADTVMSDHLMLSIRATRHLIEHGHTKIGFIGDRAVLSTVAMRHSGFLQTMHAAGLSPTPEHIRLEVQGRSEGQDAVRSLMSSPEPPTAIITAKNEITEGAVRALHELGLQSTIAHVAIDDVQLLDVLEPAVTAVAQDTYAIGRLAAERAFARIAGDTAAPQIFHVPFKTLVRGSGEIPPPSDRS